MGIPCTCGDRLILLSHITLFYIFKMKASPFMTGLTLGLLVE